MHQDSMTMASIDYEKALPMISQLGHYPRSITVDHLGIGALTIY